MLKYTVLLATVICLAQSQRPWHAGSSNHLPQVLPQYLDERLATEQAAQAAAQAAQTGQGALGIPDQVNPLGSGAESSISTTGVNESVVGNRIDGGEGTFATATTTFPTIPSDLPVDAHGDVDLVNRIKTWPRDKQPFWFINWQAIQAHRGDANNTVQPTQTQPNTRSFFAGR